MVIAIESLVSLMDDQSSLGIPEPLPVIVLCSEKVAQQVSQSGQCHTKSRMVWLIDIVLNFPPH